MVATGVVLLLVGTASVVSGLVVVALNLAGARLRRRLRTTPLLRLGELAVRHPLPRAVLVTGQAAPGPHGVLTSPGFEDPCLWYRTEVTRKDEQGELHRTLRVVLSGGEDNVRLRDGTGEAVVDGALVSQAWHGAGVLLRRTESAAIDRAGDVASGTAIARLARAGQLPVSSRPRRSRRVLDLVEVRIPPGGVVSVLARPRRSDPGAPVRLQGRGLIHPGSPQDWAAALGEDRVTGRWLAAVLPALGLVVGALGLGLLWRGGA